MKTLFCIVGRSGSGKTSICDYCKAMYGLTQVESYTTRPPRNGETIGHVFVSLEEFDLMRPNIIGYGLFHGYEYGVTRELLEQHDLYVIEPTGVYELRKCLPNFVTVYLDVSPEIAAERMLQRGDSYEMIQSRLKNDEDLFRNFKEEADLVIDCNHISIAEAAQSLISYYYRLQNKKRRRPDNNFLMTDSEIEEVYRYREREYLLQDLKVVLCGFLNDRISFEHPLDPYGRRLLDDQKASFREYAEKHRSGTTLDSVFSAKTLNRMIERFREEQNNDVADNVTWKNIVADVVTEEILKGV